MLFNISAQTLADRKFLLGKPLLCFIMKRNMLWLAPFVSAALAFIVYAIALAPISIAEIFQDNEWRGFFLLAVLMQFGISVVLTVIAYCIAYRIKRRQR